MVVTTGAISREKLQLNHHYQQTNIQFFTGRMPFLSPNQQCQSSEGNQTKPMEQCTQITYFGGVIYNEILQFVND